MRARLVVAGLGLGLLSACDGTPTGDAGPGRPEDVASVRLFDLRGTELTQHTGLVEGQTLRVEVRLFRPDGRRLTEVAGGLELTFAFNPASLASSEPVDGQPLSRDVTASAVSGTSGGLTVSLRFPLQGVTRTFGPFHVQVQPSPHAGVASLRLFDSRGAELTQHMPITAGQTLRVEVRLYDETGNRVTSVEGGVEFTFAFDPVSLATAVVAEAPFLWDVTASPNAGASGSLSVTARFLADDVTKTYGPIEVLVH